MEFIFHLFFWQNVKVSLFPGLAVIVLVSFLQSFLQSLLKGKVNKIFGGVCLGVDYLLFASQLVYRSIFKQPLLIDAIILGGGDALTNYWREALKGILDAGLGRAKNLESGAGRADGENAPYSRRVYCRCLWFVGGIFLWYVQVV